MLTCAGNGSAAGEDIPCAAATETCPQPGDTRFWVYEQTWDPAAGAYGPFVRREQPQFVCLGPGQTAAVDPLIAVAAAVRAQWQTFELPGATVQTRPGGQTLVNVPTRFSSDSPSALTLPPRTVLGYQVTLSIQAAAYRWDFGDGTVQEARPGGATPPGTEHTYRVAGQRTVDLLTTYTATFTIAGSPTVYPLTGTAVVPGIPAQLGVRESRTELVAD